MAPTGASTFMTVSTKETERQTRTPAMAPIMMEPTGLTKPEGPVIATRPASSPLPDMEASGLPKRNQMYNIAAKAPEELASMVLTAMLPMRRLPLPEAPSLERSEE